MITDSVLVCHFPRDAFTTVNQKKAEQFLWAFLNELNVLRISSGERWLEIQCGQSISLKQVETLNTKLQHTIDNAVSDYDIMQHTKLYLKIMYEMGRLAEGVAQIINVKDSTMCHGVASELLTEVKKFAGHSLPQQLQLYQYHAPNAKAFGYTDIPDIGHIGSGALGPTAPMTSTGIHLTDDINSYHQQQQLLNKLTQINYMQQVNALNNNPFGGGMNMNSLNMNMMANPVQYQQQQLLLKQQQLLVQQQLTELNNNKASKKHTSNAHPQQVPLQTHPQQGALFKSNVNNKAMNEINNEYIKLLAEQEAKKRNKNRKKDKKRNKNKKKHRKQKSGSSSSSSSSSSTDSDDDDDDDSDSDDESDSSSSDSDDSDDFAHFKSKNKKKEAVKRTNSAPKHIAGIGLVDDDEEMKYPPIPFANATGKDINLEHIMTPHVEEQAEKHSKEFKKALKLMEKKRKKKKKKNKKREKSSCASSSSLSSDDSDDSDDDDDDDDESDDDDDDDDTDSDDDSEDESDDESDSDSSDSDDDDDDDDDSDKLKKKKTESRKFEQDLDLLLNGHIDDYISRNMPLQNAGGMSPKYEAQKAQDAASRKRRREELRPHSLSIQIKDAEELDQLKQIIGDLPDSEDGEEEKEKEEKEEEKEESENKAAVGKSYKRKFDQIIRQSEHDLAYTKNLLGMVETDRNTPDLHHSPVGDYGDVVAHIADRKKEEFAAEKREKESKKNKKKEKKKNKKDEKEGNKKGAGNKHKQHLDDMIANIMAGKEFVPFADDEDSEQLFDKARESEDGDAEIELMKEEDDDDELDAIDLEIGATNDINDLINKMNEEDDDEDVDEMFIENNDDKKEEIISADLQVTLLKKESSEDKNSLPENSTPELSKNKSFQSLITAALGPTAAALAINPAARGHHKRESTRLLLDSLRPSTSSKLDSAAVEVEVSNLNNVEIEETAAENELMMMITWGMILIELDNFDQLLAEIGMDRAELIEIISTLIDESLEYENQYVDHMTEGQFVLLTPVDIVVQEGDAHRDKDSDYFYKKKEDRLHDIAASVLHHLSQEEEQLEFCMGVALQDRVSSDQEWFEIARQSLEEMKQYREIDRQNHAQSMSVTLAPAAAAQQLQLFDVDKLRRRSHKHKKKEEEEEEQVIDDDDDDDEEEEEEDAQIFSALDNLSAADLDYQDSAGDTALIIACGSRQHKAADTENNNNDAAEYVLAADLNVVEAIIVNGCNVNLRNKEGMSALMFAAMNGDNAVVTRLCIAGAKLEIKGIASSMTKTALLFAAENGHHDVCETLLTFGANINCLSDDNQSNVLMLCVNNNHIETIKFFLNYNSAAGHKLNINHQNNYGYTALMIAAYNGNQYVVEMLIEHGADCNIKNNQNENAYAIARKENHIDLCQMLLPLQSFN